MEVILYCAVTRAEHGELKICVEKLICALHKQTKALLICQSADNAQKRSVCIVVETKLASECGFAYRLVCTASDIVICGERAIGRGVEIASVYAVEYSDKCVSSALQKPVEALALFGVEYLFCVGRGDGRHEVAVDYACLHETRAAVVFYALVCEVLGVELKYVPHEIHVENALIAQVVY